MSTLAKLTGHDFAPGAEPTRFESLAGTFGHVATMAIGLLVAAIVLIVLVRALAALLSPAPTRAGSAGEPDAASAPPLGDSRSLRKAREAERDEALYAYRPDPELRAGSRVA